MMANMETRSVHAADNVTQLSGEATIITSIPSDVLGLDENQTKKSTFTHVTYAKKSKKQYQVIVNGWELALDFVEPVYSKKEEPEEISVTPEEKYLLGGIDTEGVVPVTTKPVIRNYRIRVPHMYTIYKRQLRTFEDVDLLDRYDDFKYVGEKIEVIPPFSDFEIWMASEERKELSFKLKQVLKEILRVRTNGPVFRHSKWYGRNAESSPFRPQMNFDLGPESRKLLTNMTNAIEKMAEAKVTVGLDEKVAEVASFVMESASSSASEIIENSGVKNMMDSVSDGLIQLGSFIFVLIIAGTLILKGGTYCKIAGAILGMIPVVYYLGKPTCNLIASFCKNLTSDNFKPQMGQEIFTKFIELVFVLLHIKVLKDTPPGKRVDSFMKQIGSLPRLAQGTDTLVSWLMKQIKLILESFNSIFKTELRINQTQLLDVENWVRDVEKYDHKALTPENHVRLQTLMAKGRDLENTYKGDHKTIGVIKVSMAALQQTASIFSTNNLTGESSRMVPLFLMLSGAPGVGKTTAIEYLLKDILYRSFHKMEMIDKMQELHENPDNVIYMRVPETGFWDGYKGQFVTFFDDFGQIIDIAGNGDCEMMNIIRSVSSYSYPLHMAHLNAKGKSFFNSKMVVCTSNLNKIKTSAINSVEAVERRFDYYMYVVPKVEYCIEGTTNGSIHDRRLDNSKLNITNGIDKDAYEFYKANMKDKTNVTSNGHYNVFDKPYSWNDLVEGCIGEFCSKFNMHKNTINTLKQYEQDIFTDLGFVPQMDRLLGEETKGLFDKVKPLDKPRYYGEDIIITNNDLRERALKGIVENENFVDIHPSWSNYCSMPVKQIMRLLMIEYNINKDVTDIDYHPEAYKRSIDTLLGNSCLIPANDMLIYLEENGVSVKKMNTHRNFYQWLINAIYAEKGQIWWALNVNAYMYYSKASSVETVYARFEASEHDSDSFRKEMRRALRNTKANEYLALKEQFGIKETVTNKFSAFMGKIAHGFVMSGLVCTEVLPSIVGQAVDFVKQRPLLKWTLIIASILGLLASIIGLIFAFMKKDTQEEDNKTSKKRFAGHFRCVKKNKETSEEKEETKYTEEKDSSDGKKPGSNSYIGEKDSSDGKKPGSSSYIGEKKFYKGEKDSSDGKKNGKSSYVGEKDSADGKKNGKSSYVGESFHTEYLKATYLGDVDEECIDVDTELPVPTNKQKTHPNEGFEYNAQFSQEILTADTPFLSQGGKDVIGTALANKIYNSNLYSMQVNGRHKGFVVFLRNYCFMMPRHYTTYYSACVNEGLCSREDKVLFKSPSCSRTIECKIRNLIDVTNVGINSDIVIGTVNIGNLHSDLVSKFFSRNNLPDVDSTKVLLDVPNRDMFGVTTYVTRAKRQKLFVESDGGDYVVDESMTYIAQTEGGDCGSILRANTRSGNERLIGMHVAGNNTGYGASSITFREDLEEALVKVDKFAFKSEMEELWRPICKAPINAQFTGLYWSELNIVSAGKTKIKESPLHNKWGDSNQTPARFRPFTGLDGETKIPYEIGLKGYGGKTRELNQTWVDACVSSTFSTVSKATIHIKKRNVIDFHTSIVGDPNRKFLDAIPRATSAGYPYSSMFYKGEKHKGKKLFFGEEGEYTMDTELVKQLEVEVMDIIEKAKQGIRCEHIYQDFMKDERRPYEKAMMGKTRLISGSPLAYLVACRMYFLDFNVAMMETCIENGMCVGINPYSEQWDFLARKLQSKGEKVVAGDYGGFDKTEIPQVHEAIVHGINRWYNDGPENALVRQVLFADLYSAKHIDIYGKIYQYDHCLPSGHMLTTIENSLYNHVIFRYCWILAHDSRLDQLEYFNDLVYLAAYGDDNVCNIADVAISRFNQNTITEKMAEIDMEYTIETKQKGVVPPDFRYIQDIEFLKRFFRKCPKYHRYLAPLRLEVIKEMPYWTKTGVQEEQIPIDNVQTALKELSLHPEPLFNEVSQLMREACFEESIPIGVDHFETLKSIVLHSEAFY